MTKLRLVTAAALGPPLEEVHFDSSSRHDLPFSIYFQDFVLGMASRFKN